MPNLIITSYPSPLPTSRVDNNSPAVAEVARSLAGRARWLYEMATGESGEADAVPGVTRNPQGLFGIDHSGAPYGVAMQHAVAGIGRALPPSAAADWIDGGGREFSTEKTTIRGFIYVKKHAPGSGPYSELSLDMRIKASGSINAEITIRNMTTGDVATVATKALTSTFAFYGATLMLKTAPGRNEIVLEITPASGTIDACNWGLAQIVQIRDL